jgi:hypothetical protein
MEMVTRMFSVLKSSIVVSWMFIYLVICIFPYRTISLLASASLFLYLYCSPILLMGPFDYTPPRFWIFLMIYSLLWRKIKSSEDKKSLADYI